MLRVTGCELRVARCALRVACCALRVARYGLRVACCALRVAGNLGIKSIIYNIRSDIHCQNHATINSKLTAICSLFFALRAIIPPLAARSSQLNVMNLTSISSGSSFPATKGSRFRAVIVLSRLESRSQRDNIKP